MSENQFHGSGFEGSEFREDERRRFRHMLYILDANFKQIDAKTFNALSDGATLVLGIRILFSIIKVGGPVGLFGLGFGAFARSQGWI